MLSHFSHVQLFVTHGLWPARLLCAWDSLGKNTGVGCHALLQGIFPAQGSNPHILCLLYWQMGSLPNDFIVSQNSNFFLLGYVLELIILGQFPVYDAQFFFYFLTRRFYGKKIWNQTQLQELKWIYKCLQSRLPSFCFSFLYFNGDRTYLIWNVQTRSV